MIHTQEVTTETFTVEADHEIDEMAAKIKQAAATDEVLRIEEDVYARWSGVRGCCTGDTPNNNVKAAFAKWVQKKLYDYRDLRYIRYGHGGGTANCRTTTSGWPDNRTSCTGSATVKAYIEFVKP